LGEVLKRTFPPALVDEYYASKKTGERRDKNRFYIEIATLAIVAIYAALTAVQSCQAIKSADAAKSAADTARDALHVSERAYINIATPKIDAAQGLFYLPIQNTGHIPSGIAQIIVHEATFNAPAINPEDISSAAEKHWKKQDFISIAPGMPLQINVLLPAASAQKLIDGQQIVIVAGSISANDGFPDTPQRNGLFCWFSISHLNPKELNVMPCDPKVFVPQLEKIDGYPNGEQQYNGPYQFPRSDRK